MDIISYSKAKKAEALAKSADDRLTRALKDSKPIDQVSDALVDSKGNKSDTLKKRLDNRDVSVDASLNAINNQLIQSNRTTQVLQNGVSVINSEVATPASFQFEGRTLVNMGNSDLEDGKYYVLADRKTKVKTYKEDTWKQGVAKFQRENSLVTKGDFTGKVVGSLTENPHLFKHVHSSDTLRSPSEFTVEHSSVSALLKVDNSTAITGVNVQPAGFGAMQLFSFNVIEHIERKIGTIPKTTILEKVQWIKDNVHGIIVRAFARGIGPSGNKASMRFWNGTTWLFDVSHTSANISLLANGGSTAVSSYVMNDGYFHALCFAESSDGVVGSVITTDFIEMEVTLKNTAQLNKKPIFSRVANFEGKNDNPSSVPHFFRTTSGGTGAKTLQTTDSAMWVNRDSMTSTVEKLNGVSFMNNTIVAEAISQQIFSFNIIEEVERNICKIPGNSTIEKVNWLKLNLNKYVFNWYGYGGGPNGNKVYIKRWIGSWFGETSHSSSNVSKLQSGTATPSSEIPADGIVHFLAFADPSDGVKDSYVYTDYAELEIELKADARIVNPFVPLYEVPKAEYDKVLVEWNESQVLNRYPKIEGVQHLQNVAVIADGENLLPPFNEWSLHSNSKVINPYEFEITSTARYQSNTLLMAAYPNTTYTMNIENLSDKIGVSITSRDIFNNNLEVSVNTIFHTPKTFTTPGKTALIHINLFNYAPENGVFSFKNPTLSLGSKPKAFVARNPSYLFSQLKLGQIADKKDLLFKEDGEWKIRKEIEKDVILDGGLTWLHAGNHGATHKRVRGGPFNNYNNLEPYFLVQKNTGKKIQYFASIPTKEDQGFIYSSDSNLYLSISNEDSGWAESFLPVSDMIKRYFNGWKYKDGTTWDSVTGNGQTATAATSLTTKPADYTPYKLSYALSTPKIEIVSEKIEGEVALNGNTQIEVTSGIVSKEKVIPKVVSGSYAHINYRTDVPSQTRNKTQNILGVYRDGKLDKEWISEKSNTAWKVEGTSGMYIPVDKYDPKANYTISYVVSEKEKFSTNVLDARVTYAQNIRSSQEDLAKLAEDTATQVSISRAAIIDLYVQLKALKP